jgi:hypothetical protein
MDAGPSTFAARISNTWFPREGAAFAADTSVGSAARFNGLEQTAAERRADMASTYWTSFAPSVAARGSRDAFLSHPRRRQLAPFAAISSDGPGWIRTGDLGFRPRRDPLRGMDWAASLEEAPTMVSTTTSLLLSRRAAQRREERPEGTLRAAATGHARPERSAPLLISHTRSCGTNPRI